MNICGRAAVFFLMVSSAVPCWARQDTTGLVFLVPGWHGQGSYQDTAEFFEGQHYATCQAKLPDDGTLDEFVIEAARELDTCLASHSKPRFVLGYGSSLGAYIVARVAAIRPGSITILALHAPANYPDMLRQTKLSEVIEVTESHEKLVKWRTQPLECGDLVTNIGVESLCKFQRLGGKTLILAGTQDDLIPRQTAENMCRAAKGDEIFLDGLEHGSALNPRIAQLVNIWLQGVLPRRITLSK